MFVYPLALIVNAAYEEAFENHRMPKLQIGDNELAKFITSQEQEILLKRPGRAVAVVMHRISTETIITEEANLINALLVQRSGEMHPNGACTQCQLPPAEIGLT